MTHSEKVYSKHLQGRKVHIVASPSIRPSNVPFVYENCKSFHIAPNGQLYARISKEPTPIAYTGQLSWYVGRSITLIGTFQEGLIQNIEVED